MSIVLPTTKVKAQRVNPKRLVIYSKPKTGKTTCYSGLENNLILDLENGTDFLEALKIPINNLQEVDIISSIRWTRQVIIYLNYVKRQETLTVHRVD